jgi:serpin B
MRSASILTLFFLTLGCSGNEAPLPLPPPGEEVGSNLARLTTPAPPADLQSLVRGQNDFAFGLYRTLTAPGENLFLSPLSISTALSMTYAGAGGTTAAAFEALLGSGLAPAAHHRAMNHLDAALNARGQGATAADGGAFRLQTTNQLFAQAGFPFETPFLDTLALEYGARVRLLDFLTEAEPSRKAINAWVESRTEQRIKELLAEGIITPDTVLVLVNAIYFNAAWKTAFAQSATSAQDFTRADGTKTSVPMMHGPELSARAAQVDGLEVFELPYDGDELSMLVIVPPHGGLAALEGSLDAARIEALTAGLAQEHLDLRLPKFEIRTSAALRPKLTQLGLGVAFSGDADFSPMSTAAGLSVSEVVHQAFVLVNEAGTEAAAATAVIVGRDSAPASRPLVVDRPFVFAIRDHATGALVFVGRVVEP